MQFKSQKHAIKQIQVKNMGKEIAKQKPTKRVLAGIGCAAIIAAIIGYVLSQDTTNPPIFASNLSSGPFSVDSSSYKVGDKITLKATGIPPQLLGEAVFIQPNGNIHHTLPIDGSKKPSINHYFKLLPHTTKNCIPYNYIGTWEISFRTLQGEIYNPISFEVTDDRAGTEDIEAC